MLFVTCVFECVYAYIASSTLTACVMEHRVLHTIHCVYANMILPFRAELVAKYSLGGFFQRKFQFCQKKEKKTTSGFQTNQKEGCKACRLLLTTRYRRLEALKRAPPRGRECGHMVCVKWAGLDSEGDPQQPAQRLWNAKERSQGCLNACYSLGLWAASCPSLSLSTYNQRNSFWTKCGVIWKPWYRRHRLQFLSCWMRNEAWVLKQPNRWMVSPSLSC